MTKKKSILNWSSGKDSAFTLYKILKDASVEIKYLVTTINKVQDRVSMHGVRKTLLQKQVKNIGIPLKIIELPAEPSLDEYNDIMKNELTQLVDEGIELSIYGDISLEDLRKYRENKLSEIGMQAVFPLWNIDSNKLVTEFLEAGFKAKIVCVNDKYFTADSCGVDFNKDFLKNISDEVNPCGEKGEYHSFVYDGPIFSKPVEFIVSEIVHKNYNPCNKDRTRCKNECDKGKNSVGFWYADLIDR